MAAGDQNPGKRQKPLLERDGMIASAELAEFLGVPIPTLDQWASRGDGPIFHKVGKYRRYLPADVKKWLAGRRHETSSEPAKGAA